MAGTDHLITLNTRARWVLFFEPSPFFFKKGVDMDIGKAIDDICQRSFIAETHPAKPEKWNNLKLIQYSIDGHVRFEMLEL